MKHCPNCGELLGDAAEICFKCNYSFEKKRVIPQEELRTERENREKKINKMTQAQEAQRVNAEANRRAAEAKRKELLAKAKFKGQSFITTGFNFEGYKIVAYYGIASGSAVIGTGVFSEFVASISDFLGGFSGEFSNIINEAEEVALKNLLKDSEELGGNAIIGVDFDYITFNNNMIGVIAKGTSVLIEKEEKINKEKALDPDNDKKEDSTQ